MIQIVIGGPNALLRGHGFGSEEAGMKQGKAKSKLDKDADEKGISQEPSEEGAQ